MSLIKIKCPHCLFEKNVERAKIPDNLKEIKCPKCKEPFPFEAPEEDFVMEPLPSAVDESAPKPVAQEFSPAGSKLCSSCGKQIHIEAEICPGCGVRVTTPKNAISKLALLLITFFLGGLGGHKFYTKKYLAGTLYLLFFWTYIPTLVAIVEFIIYACKSEEELQRKFPETGRGAIAIVIIIPVFIAIVGILAAIAIPQFAAYRQKAYNAVAHNDLSICKSEVTAYRADYGFYPVGAEQIQCNASKDVALYYLLLDSDNYQVISFHDKGSKAFIAEATGTAVAENEKAFIEQEIEQMFGRAALERKFHVLEND